MRIADLVRDQTLLAEVQRAADYLIERHPGRVEPLIRRWIGGRLAYGKV
jgi:ATP-dependent DNA helicase RecG